MITTNNKEFPGMIYLKDYSAHFLTKGDMRLLDNPRHPKRLAPILMDKEYFGPLGFSYCFDNSGKGFYFKGYGCNFWYSIKDGLFYYCGRNFHLYFLFLHALQHFLIYRLKIASLDFSILFQSINDHYKPERQLFTMSYADRRDRIDKGKLLIEQPSISTSFEELDD